MTWGISLDISSFSWGIFSHVMHFEQLGTSKNIFLIITGDIPAVIFPNFQSWHLMHQLSSIRSGFKLVESFVVDSEKK